MTLYQRPQTLPEALALLAGSPRQVLAGGTDIYPALAGAELRGPVLDLTGVAGLRGIVAGPDGLRIGACTTWAEVAAAALPPALAAVQQAAVQIGGRQIQNAGTIGGNLCHASPAADGVPPLLVLGAEVELASPRGLRRLVLADFITGPRRTARAADEVLVAVLIPQAALAGQSRFLKLGARAWLVISIAMVAVRIVAAQGRVAEAALAVGACSAVARRLPGVEAHLIGAPLADAAGLISDAAVAAALDPLDDLRGTATYRATAAAELLRRAVADVAEAGA
ncbi:MAG: FAD binding domain-containing protein [Pseudorhodobacter sp.]|nr:FAD binding domain-containing protein [Pseudorhodobacter sp.]